MLDPRVDERIRGPGWGGIRSHFERVNAALQSVSPNVRGELTTIYVKYTTPETGKDPFAVLWLRTCRLVLGLTLPDDYEAPQLTEPPPRMKYAGLTRYLTITAESDVPEKTQQWIRDAYCNAVNARAT